MTTFSVNDIKKQHNPFVMPEGYLADFADRMMQRIAATQVVEEKQMRIVHWIPWLGVACVAILTLLFAHGQHTLDAELQQKTTETATIASTNNSVDDVYDYLMMNNITEMDAYETDN